MTLVASAPTSLAGMVAEVRGLQARVGESMWLLGKALARLEKSGKWREKHARWNDFTQAEFQLTGQYVRRLIDVSENFSERQVRECGTSKLIKILPVPAERRGEFVKLATTASASEVRASVNRFQLKRAKEHPAGIVLRRETGRPSAIGRKIMHIDAEERTVALYASDSATRRAKRLEDRPWGRVLLGGKAYLAEVRLMDQGLVLGLTQEPDES